MRKTTRRYSTEFEDLPKPITNATDLLDNNTKATQWVAKLQNCPKYRSRQNICLVSVFLKTGVDNNLKEKTHAIPFEMDTIWFQQQKLFVVQQVLLPDGTGTITCACAGTCWYWYWPLVLVLVLEVVLTPGLVHSCVAMCLCMSWDFSAQGDDEQLRGHPVRRSLQHHFLSSNCSSLVLILSISF